jgi:hypothetical protein
MQTLATKLNRASTTRQIELESNDEQQEEQIAQVEVKDK